MLTLAGMKRNIPLIVGNWKLNPQSLVEATALVSAVAKYQKKAEAPYVAIAPSFVHLTEVKKKLGTSTVALGAQDISTEPLGAFTGEISGAQLRNLGVEYVIIGHSERRAMGETDAQVATKTAQALKNKLTPIVCVGETTRDPQGTFFSLIETQLRSLTKDLKPLDVKRVVIAYEPIWAIGTGKTATREDVKEMQLFIYSVLAKIYDRKTADSIRLLYGGSVKPQNAAEIQANGGMNGFLVGGASLKATDFSEIIKLSYSK